MDSIDAALAAVPAGMTWNLGKWHNAGSGEVVYWFDLHGREELQSRSPNAAEAIRMTLAKLAEKTNALRPLAMAHQDSIHRPSWPDLAIRLHGLPRMV